MKTLVHATVIALVGIISAHAQAPAKPAAPTPPPNLTREVQALMKGALQDFDAKNYDDALKKLEEANTKIPNDAFVQNLLGAAYTKKKQYDKALTYFEASLKLQPDFFPAKFNVGELLFLQRRYAEAQDYFEKMLQADPQNELLQFKIFLCQLQLGQKDVAEKTLKTIRYPSNTPAWYYAQAAWWSKAGDNKKAAEYVSGARYIFGPKTALFDETFDDLGIELR